MLARWHICDARRCRHKKTGCTAGRRAGARHTGAVHRRHGRRENNVLCRAGRGAGLHRCRGKPHDFDLYRITSPEDLEAAGLFDYLAQGAIVAVEWSELANGWFAGEKAVQVDIRQGAAEDERIITIEGAGL